MFYMWGWASWADRWKSVRIDDMDVPAVRRALQDGAWLQAGFWMREYWLAVLEMQAAGRIDSWGYPAQFHCFARGLYSATPTKNLVLNIGEGPSATRTSGLRVGPFNRATEEMAFPLVACATYEGPEALSGHERRWRLQLTPWVVFRQVMHRRFPRLYAAMRGAVQAARSARGGA